MGILLTLMDKMVDGVFASIPRSRPPLHVVHNTLLVAHRGAHNNKQGIIENTHRAFQHAKDLGCWGIEFDVRSTADDVLIVHHDPTLIRLWHHNAAIEELTFSQLRQLAPEIPSLAEVVAQYSDALHLFIELKVPIADQQNFLAVLSSCEPIRNYHLLTLDPTFYDPIAHIPKAALLLVAVHNNAAAFCDLSIKKNYGGVLGNYLLLTNNLCQQLAQAQQSFGVGFVNSKNSLYRELNRGIHWLFTNEAQRVIRYLF